MTNFLKKIIQWKLRLLTKIYLSTKHIEIVAITGSAGKTTAKMTIGQIIPSNTIYVPAEAYNTEYGVPLAVFREKIPVDPKNLFSWAGLLMKMFVKLFQLAPYKRIVLEYGADKPGDISYLTSFAKPHISLVTAVLPVHLEGFRDVDAVAEEKSRLVSVLTKDDFAILNFDDKKVRAMTGDARARVISFGKEGTDIEYSGLKYSEAGMALDVVWKENKYGLNIPVAAPQLLPTYLGAFAVGLLLGEDPKQLVKKLSHIKPEKGRMNVLAGQNGSTIIDDSYNSNPTSAKAALEVLSKFSGRKIVVIGSMNELGEYEKQGHEEVALAIAKMADEVLVVGEAANIYIYPIVSKKLGEKAVHRFEASSEAGKYLSNILQKGDVALFKGSQNGVFLEEAVKYVLSEPDKAADLLVRQDAMWQKKKGTL